MHRVQDWGFPVGAVFLCLTVLVFQVFPQLYSVRLFYFYGVTGEKVPST